MQLTNPTEIKALLNRHGFRFSKAMGHNFLTAAWVPERIAQEALSLYRGEPRRQVTCARLAEACRRLGPPGAAGRVAEKILAAARRHVDRGGTK